jgi:hypothetical protein
MLGQVKSGYVRIGLVWPGQVRIGNVRSGYFSYVRAVHFRTCYDTLGQFMSGYELIQVRSG